MMAHEISQIYTLFAEREGPMSEDLEYIACPAANCGGQWLPAGKVRQLRESHQTFYCPSGHSQWFAGKTAQEKRIEELENLVKVLTNSRDTYKRWWEQLRKENRTEKLRRYALKGVISKLKKVS